MTKVLFNIQLRISSEVIDLPVIQGDSNNQLLERLCNNESVKKEFRKILNQKLKDSLLLILDNKHLDLELKQKVQTFINNEMVLNTNNQKEHLEKKGKKLESRGEWINKRISSTPNNIIENQHNTSFASNISSIPRLNLSKQKKLLQLPQNLKNILPPIAKSPTASKQVIAAYQTVLNKCRDPELKIMISKTLSDLQNKQQTTFMSRINHSSITPVESVTHTCQINPEQSLYQTPQQFYPERRRSPFQWRSTKSIKSIPNKSKSGGKYQQNIRQNYNINKSLNTVQSVQTLLPKSQSKRRFNYLVQNKDSLY